MSSSADQLVLYKNRQLPLCCLYTLPVHPIHPAAYTD